MKSYYRSFGIILYKPKTLNYEGTNEEKMTTQIREKTRYNILVILSFSTILYPSSFVANSWKDNSAVQPYFWSLNRGSTLKGLLFKIVFYSGCPVLGIRWASLHNNIKFTPEMYFFPGAKSNFLLELAGNTEQRRCDTAERRIDTKLKNASVFCTGKSLGRWKCLLWHSGQNIYGRPKKRY